MLQDKGRFSLGKKLKVSNTPCWKHEFAHSKLDNCPEPRNLKCIWMTVVYDSKNWLAQPCRRLLPNHRVQNNKGPPRLCCDFSAQVQPEEFSGWNTACNRRSFQEKYLLSIEHVPITRNTHTLSHGLIIIKIWRPVSKRLLNLTSFELNLS